MHVIDNDDLKNDKIIWNFTNMHTDALEGKVCKVYGDHSTLNHKSYISTCKGTRIGRSLLKYRSVASINGWYIDLGSIWGSCNNQLQGKKKYVE